MNLPLCDPVDFAAALPATGALIGLDLGTKAFGLAISDPDRTVALPLSVHMRTELARDAQMLVQLIQHRKAAGLVIGLPLGLDGTRGERAEAVDGWAAKLLRRDGFANLPTLLWDERMSTVAVERFLRDDLDMSRAKRAKSVDAHAAAHILQGVLDWLARANRQTLP